MYYMQVDTLPSGAEAAMGTNALYEVTEGDFASGVRTQLAHAGVAGDFATGLRSTPNSMLVGDFAAGMRAVATVVGSRGDFATGQRGESTSASRRPGRLGHRDGSLHWCTPEPVGVS